MIEGLIAFALKHWRTLVELLAVLAVVGSIYFYLDGLYSKIDQQANTIAQLQSANKILTDNNEKLQVALTANTQAIVKMAGATDQTVAAFAKLSTTVKTQSVSLETRLKQIMQEKKPATCEDTILYLIQAAKEYQK